MKAWPRGNLKFFHGTVKFPIFQFWSLLLSSFHTVWKRTKHCTSKVKLFWGATVMAVHVKCNYNTSLMKSQFCTQGTKSHTIFWTIDHHNYFSLLLPRRLQPVISNYVMALLTRKCRLTSVILTEKRRLKSEKIEKIQ